MVLDDLERFGEEAVMACFKVVSVIWLEGLTITWNSLVSIVGALSEIRTWYVPNALPIEPTSSVSCFYGNRRFIALFTRTYLYRILGYTLIQFTPGAISERSVLILHSILCLDLASGPLMFAFVWLLAWLTRWPWRWRQYMPSKVGTPVPNYMASHITRPYSAQSPPWESRIQYPSRYFLSLGSNLSSELYCYTPQ
jgi:hypothetical protein